MIKCQIYTFSESVGYDLEGNRPCGRGLMFHVELPSVVIKRRMEKFEAIL